MPGNGVHYGIEIDAALRYHDIREPIFFQVQYGVLFPFNALDRPGDQFPSNEDFIVPNDGDARAAQAVQAQIGIKF